MTSSSQWRAADVDQFIELLPNIAASWLVFAAMAQLLRRYGNERYLCDGGSIVSLSQ